MMNRKAIAAKSVVIISVVLIQLYCTTVQGQETLFKREITLYNPFKPSLPDVVKKSLLPDMTDTAKIVTNVKYDIKTKPYSPPYTVTPLKAATMLPDPLTKLYNGFINLGLGSYLTPLAEVSLSNLRSKQGIVGLYAGHFSTNSKIKLDNDKKIFSGYQDNNAVIYGSKFLRESIIKADIVFSQKTRHAYGYNPSILDYDPEKKEIKTNYLLAGANAGISSMNSDSSELAYDIDISYDLFTSGQKLFQHTFNLTGSASREIKGFYAGTGLVFELYAPSDRVWPSPGYVFSLNPSVKKRTPDWNVKLGAVFLLDKFIMDDDPKFHIYPDMRFGFNVIPAYVNFFTELSGKLEKNSPDRVVNINPFIHADGIYRIRNTSYPVIVRAGLEGETGIEGLYRLSASYTVADKYLLLANYQALLGMVPIFRGNYFKALSDEAEIFNLSGEMAGRINRHFTFSAKADYYRYTLTDNEFPWGKPDWDAEFNLEYNLRDKILACLGVNAAGNRKFLAITEDMGTLSVFRSISQQPAHLNFNLSVEYRYTKILSFWLKINNISFSRFYEWNWYPSLRFITLAGFTYSL